MPLQTWLADSLRRQGLTVVESPGWQTAGDPAFTPRGLVIHHTASSRNGGDTPSLSLVRRGRPDLPPPLCHVLVGRNGVCFVIAAGKANHAGVGTWKGLSGNSAVLGIEAENDGIGEPWTHHLYDVMVRASAALLAAIGRDANWCCGHKEWAPARKIDPAGINMDVFRADVHEMLTTGQRNSSVPPPMMEPPREVQQVLVDAGFLSPDPGADGKIGPATVAAVHALKNAWLAQQQSARDWQAQAARLETELAQARAAVGNTVPIRTTIEAMAEMRTILTRIETELGQLII